MAKGLVLNLEPKAAKKGNVRVIMPITVIKRAIDR